MLAGCLLGLVWLGLGRDHHLADGPGLRAATLGISLALLPVLGTLQLLGGRRAARLLGAGLCLVAVSDLTRYYAEASRIDQAFTAAAYPLARPVPLPDRTRDAL